MVSVVFLEEVIKEICDASNTYTETNVFESDSMGRVFELRFNIAYQQVTIRFRGGDNQRFSLVNFCHSDMWTPLENHFIKETLKSLLGVNDA